MKIVRFTIKQECDDLVHTLGDHTKGKILQGCHFYDTICYEISKQRFYFIDPKDVCILEDVDIDKLKNAAIQYYLKYDNSSVGFMNKACKDIYTQGEILYIQKLESDK